MKSKVYYWCPFIDKVATVKSVINSSFCLVKYDQLFKPILLNVCGEWSSYKDELKEKNISVQNLTELKILPIRNKRKGFLFSRLLYFYIFFKTLIPLIRFLKNNKENFLVVHLITSLPLFLNLFIKDKCNIILRISGLPKFSFFRKLLWSISINNIKIVFCPTENTKKDLERVFPNYKNKFRVLRDPALDIKDIQKQKRETEVKFDKEYFVSIGRFTKQKNYTFLLKGLNEFYKNKDANFLFLIVGEGEEKSELNNFIVKNSLSSFIKILDYKNNIFPLLKNAKALISTSLYEDPGFTLIEAGYLNIPVISSDCPNGPKEILDNGNNGYIFESENLTSFKSILSKFLSENKDDQRLKKIRLKRFVKKFTIFSHYQILKKSLNEIKKS
tara:strand:- start:54 stop:1214 length:1161 start_codon:yes stop_codon:yes gene_type:complete